MKKFESQLADMEIDVLKSIDITFRRYKNLVTLPESSIPVSSVVAINNDVEELFTLTKKISELKRKYLYSCI